MIYLAFSATLTVLAVTEAFSGGKTRLGKVSLLRNNARHCHRNHHPTKLCVPLFTSEQQEQEIPLLRRTRLAGVSVTPQGFIAILQTAPYSRYIPLSITTRDTQQVMSPQALTILQLLGDIDMAGPLLPPDILSRIMIAYIETINDRNREETKVWSSIISQLDRILATIGTDRSSDTFTAQHVWVQSRIKLPQCTLDQVVWKGNNEIELQVRVREIDATLKIPLNLDMVQRAYLYRDDDDDDDEDNQVHLVNFLTVSLALRYKAPMVLGPQFSSDDFDATELSDRFPLYRSASAVHQSSTRVVHNIERGFQVNQLQAALRLALQKEDITAATKIRAKLDQLDSLQDLPTQEESDTSSME